MKISVITVNLNNLDGLKKTIKSVLGQTYGDFEYIIVDGASTDGSAEYLREVKSVGKILKVISEPDKGIYNAMNKGILLAQGEYIHFLNSGDFLVNTRVYEEMLEISKLEADVVYGNRIEIYPDGKQVLNKGLQRSGLTFSDAYRGSIPHTAAITKRSLFDKYGLFNETYQIESDTEFFLKAVGLGGCSTEYIDKSISYFDMSGISKNPETKGLQQWENEDMKRKMLTNELVDAYEFAQQYGYKIERINKKRWSAFMLRVLNRLAYLINGDNLKNNSNAA